jgi:Zn-dependent protease/CBS domain-containing protein
MFGKRIKLFQLLGFEVRIDLSWFIIAALITWTLAVGVFPHYYKNLTTATYWWMGVAGALGLFFSVVFHELTHSVISRMRGLPMKGITLFIFGGVAEMREEPESAKTEFWMAIAGPISSAVLGIVFYGFYRLGAWGNWPIPVNGVLAYLGMINFILAAFNLVPAYPLDGGRVLRSALWKWKNNIRWATRVASQIGSGFGIALVVLGVINFIAGNLIGGVWWFLIGLFLRNASQMSYRQLLMRRALEGEPVRRFMKTDLVTVEPSISVQQLVEEYVYRHHHKMFPVVKDSDQLAGCITTKQIKEIPRDEWSHKKVGDIVTPCSEENTVQPGMDAMKALSIMNQNKASRLMVVDGKRLAGIVTLKDMLEFFSLQLELEGEEEPHSTRQGSQA